MSGIDSHIPPDFQGESPRLITPDSIEPVQRHNLPPAYGNSRLAYGYAHGGGGHRERPLREYLVTLANFKWLLIICMAIGVAIGQRIRATQPIIYETAAMVNIGSYVPPTDGPTADAIKFETSRGEYLENLTPVLKSYALARNVLASNPDIRQYFDPSYYPEQNSQTRNSDGEEPGSDIPVSALDASIGTISTFKDAGTTLISITATAGDKRMVARIANSHAEGFMEAVRKQRFVWATTNVDFLRKRLADEEAKAKKAEEEMLNFARINNIEIGASTRTIDRSSNRYEALINDLGQITLERITTEQQLRTLRQSLNADGILYGGQTLQMLPQLQSLTADYEKKRKWGYSNAMLEPIDRQIRDLKAVMREFAKNDLREIQAKTKAAREKEDLLKKELETLKTDQRSGAQLNVHFSTLEKLAKSRKEEADKIRERLEEATINAESDQRTVQLLDAAVVPSYPVVSRRISPYISGALLGLLVGITFAFLIEHQRGAIRTVSDIQTFVDTPVLGVIPNFSRSLIKDMLPYNQILPENSSELLPLSTGDKFTQAFEDLMLDEHSRRGLTIGPSGRPLSNLVVTIKPHSRESEAFRNVRAALKFCSKNHPPRRILLTSGQKGDGKTTVSVNLAASIAQTAARTLIIDADLRMPTVHKYFHYERNQTGLGDYLSRPGRLSDFVLDTDIEHLSVMVAGSPVDNPAELIGSKRMLDLLDQASEEYDYVFVDTPPVGEIADALLICPAVDGCVLVIRSGATPKAVVQLATSRLEQVRARILGITLNGLRELDGQTDGYYGYRYGSYSKKS